MKNTSVLHLQNGYCCAVLILPHLRSYRRPRKDVEKATMVIKAKEIISDKNNVNSKRKIAHCLLIQELKAI